MKTNKGSITNEVIIWLAITIATIIALYWLINNFTYLRPDLEKIEKDLISIQAIQNEACTAINYKVKYNPITEEGEIKQEKKRTCIKTKEIQKCKDIICEAQEKTLNLAQITYVWIEKGENNEIKIRGE
ncbi:MAG: hypothetical protein QXZ13_00875 [Candidatus Diapherotrites archaeon]